jgi:hypothetical protein
MCWLVVLRCARSVRCHAIEKKARSKPRKGETPEQYTYRLFATDNSVMTFFAASNKN